MKKPFVFGVAVGDENFVGRSKEITMLSNNFKYGVNTILLAPRRMGKTSLVKRVAKQIHSDEIKVVHLDIFLCFLFLYPCIPRYPLSQRNKQARYKPALLRCGRK